MQSVKLFSSLYSVLFYPLLFVFKNTQITLNWDSLLFVIFKDSWNFKIVIIMSLVFESITLALLVLSCNIYWKFQNCTNISSLVLILEIV